MTTTVFPETPWGALIGIYFGLAGVIGGLPLIAASVLRSDGHSLLARDTKRTVLAVCGGAIAVAALLLVLDLGRPGRFYLMVTEFSATSPISVGAKLLALDGYLTAALWFLYTRASGSSQPEANAKPSRVLRVLEALALFVSLSIAIYPALVAGASYHSPLARLPGSTVLFIVTALIMGAGALSVVSSSRLTLDQPAAKRLWSLKRWLSGVQLLVLFSLALLALVGDFGRASHIVQHPTPPLLVSSGLAIIGPIITLLLRTTSRAAAALTGIGLVLAGSAARWAFVLVN